MLAFIVNEVFIFNLSDFSDVHILVFKTYFPMEDLYLNIFKWLMYYFSNTFNTSLLSLNLIHFNDLSL